MLLQNKKKKEKLEALKTMKIPVDKDLEQGLDLLEIDTGLHGHHTGFSFKKAVLDDSYIWELTIGVAHLPKRLKLSYEVHIILSPADYEIALEAQFDNLKKKQLELWGTNKHLEEMQRIHGEYKNDTARIGTFSFTATISELKNKGKETINFIVKRDVIEYIEKLAVGGTPLGRFCLVLEEL